MKELQKKGERKGKSLFTEIGFPDRQSIFSKILKNDNSSISISDSRASEPLREWFEDKVLDYRS